MPWRRVQPISGLHSTDTKPAPTPYSVGLSAARIVMKQARLDLCTGVSALPHSSRAEVPDFLYWAPSWCEILPKCEWDVRWGVYQGWYCLHANAQLYVLLTRGVTDGSVSVQAVENRAHSACSQSIQPLWGKTASWAWKSGCQQSRGKAFTQANVVGCHVKLGKRGGWD